MPSSARDEDFVAFVAASSGRLLHTALLLTGDRGRAEDLVQGALERAYLRWDHVRADDAYSYLRRSMVNANVSWWRRFHRETVHAQVPEPEPSRPTDEIDHRDQIRRALTGLTARERSVIIMRYIEDLTEQQTAAELGIAVGTVKSTTSRAMSKLRAVTVEQPIGERQ